MLPTFALLAATLIPAAEPIPLASRINGLIAEHKGNVTVACVHLGTGERLIIRGDDKKISDAIKIGFLEGMVDFTENLRQLVERGDVTKEVALEVAPNPEALKMALKGIRVATPGIL